MTLIDILWDYQKADMRVDTLEHDIRHSEKRLKLKKDRDFLLNQKNVVAKISEDVSLMNDRADAIQTAISHLETKLENIQKKFSDAPPKDQEDAREMLETVRSLAQDIATFEKEIRQLQKKANDRDKQSYDVRIRAARVKQEFVQVKAEYEPEYKKQMEELKSLRQIAADKEKEVDASLLERYNKIKPHVKPPLAKLDGNRCSGCNMTLPGVALQAFSDGAQFLECENCGRLIVIEK